MFSVCKFIFQDEILVDSLAILYRTFNNSFILLLSVQYIVWETASKRNNVRTSGGRLSCVVISLGLLSDTIFEGYFEEIPMKRVDGFNYGQAECDLTGVWTDRCLLREKDSSR